MKTALIGISNNITSHVDKIQRWRDSFEKVCGGEVILLAANMDEQDRKICNETLKINYKEVFVEDVWYINNKRLNHTVDYLKDSDVDIFLVTDVFDVLFQRNPFEDLDFNSYDLFVGSEGITISEEPWNLDVLNKCFPQYVEKSLNNFVLCSGVIAGKRESLIKLLSTMYQMCEDAVPRHNIRDQAALIALHSNYGIPGLKIFTPKDSWVVHCAVSGPTQFFEGWGFKHHIESRYGLPKLENGRLLNSKGELYSIVHQHNRIPEWYNVLNSEYNYERM